eukprot:4346979-Alexandrium_andersonii.AAC.1
MDDVSAVKHELLAVIGVALGSDSYQLGGDFSEKCTLLQIIVNCSAAEKPAEMGEAIRRICEAQAQKDAFWMLTGSFASVKKIMEEFSSAKALLDKEASHEKRLGEMRELFASISQSSKADGADFVQIFSMAKERISEFLKLLRDLGNGSESAAFLSKCVPHVSEIVCVALSILSDFDSGHMQVKWLDFLSRWDGASPSG